MAGTSCLYTCVPRNIPHITQKTDEMSKLCAIYSVGRVMCYRTPGCQRYISMGTRPPTARGRSEDGHRARVSELGVLGMGHPWEWWKDKRHVNRENKLDVYPTGVVPAYHSAWLSFVQFITYFNHIYVYYARIESRIE